MPINSTLQVTLVLLALVLFFVLLTILFRAALARSGRGIPLRPITAYQAIPRLQGRSIETGQTLHVSLGTSGIGGADTASTLAGLITLETLTDEAVASDSPPIITVSDPSAMILAQDALRRSYVRQHNAAAYDPRSVRFAAAAPIPYAVAAMDVLAHDQTMASVTVGAFGAEAALMVEEGGRRGVTQVVGTSDAAAIPLVYPSSDHLLVGEEMFVAGAYIGTDGRRLSSIIVQDVARWLIVLAILLGAVGALFK